MNRRVSPCNHPLRIESVDPEDTADRYRLLDVFTLPYQCDACLEQVGYVFYCGSCDFSAHEECINFPDMSNYACHSRHPLKIVLTNTVDYTDGKCHFCRKEVGDLMYHCSKCDFSIDMSCAVNPPPLTIYQPKSHNHTFTLMPRKVSFTCNACGMVGDRNPYVCLDCGFMLHKDCIDLPRVINVNRHDHRISRTYDLGHGEWKCGVCRKEIDWTFGAFSCKCCPNYSVHSKCAVREDVWDGEELEDVPEEEEEIEDPYTEINGEKEIIHFSHEEHNLRLGDDNATGYEKTRCDACILPIDSDPFYKCVQCKFFLHKVCACLPRKKRNILHKHKLILSVWEGRSNHYSTCTCCRQLFDGFKYICKSYTGEDFCPSEEFDVRCASISEPFHHELHPHPLYRTLAEKKTCEACGKDSKYVLSCTECEFSLGMECATLPRKVKHRCDDHVLSLHHGAGNSNGPLWCDICETKTDPSVWFYGCDECGVTLHVKCVLGDMSYLKPGNEYDEGVVVPNDGMSRPFCFTCKKRCLFPFFLKKKSTVKYACSMKCAS